MGQIDVQLFREDGTWIKPRGAVTVDIVLAGGDGAAAGDIFDPAELGGITARSVPAAELPDEVQVEVGRAGRPGLITITHVSADGYILPAPGGGSDGAHGIWPRRDGLAVIITHLAGS